MNDNDKDNIIDEIITKLEALKKSTSKEKRITPSTILDDIKNFFNGNDFDNDFKLIIYTDWIRDSVSFSKNITENEQKTIDIPSSRFKKIIKFHYHDVPRIDEISDRYAKYLYYFGLNSLEKQLYSVEIEESEDI